ncbi:MAG: polysaccharide deacetylase family protein [Bacteroidales bacterium]|nr:polysaccharide deacetylase family protein [Bacteroidales bacterium]
MSKFHVLNIAGIFLLLVIFSAGLPYLWILLLALLYLGGLVVGVFYIQFDFFLKSLNKGQTGKKQIALTFDDGPEAETTPKVIGILAKHRFKATFFCVGKKAEKHPDLLKKMDEAGHLVANHSYSHSVLFGLFSSKRMLKELKLTTRLIEKNIGKKPKLFRPPFGVTNPTLAKVLRETRLISIGWSRRSLDTVSSTEKVIRKLEKKLGAGDVVLFHDKLSSTPQMLEVFLPWLHENHFEVVGLDELLKIEPYEKT